MTTLPQTMIRPATRPLPVMVEPVTGEGFRSFVDRLAAQYEVSLATLLSQVGLIEPGSARKLAGYGVVLDDERLNRFCQVTRLEPGAVRSMLLSCYDGVAIDLSNVDPTDPAALVSRARHEWAYFWGSHFCPWCLEEDAGVWRVAWKLPWSFACVRHRVLLADTCPECGQRAGGGRLDHSLAPLFISHVPRPGCCWNPQPTGSANVGRAAVPCGFYLSDTPYIDLSGAPGLLEAQARIDMMLAQAGAADPEESASALVHFSELRSLAALTLYCAGVQELGDLPPEAQAAFSAHVADRREIIEERRVLLNPRKGRRQRVFWGAPKSAALMAAVVPLAASVLNSDSLDEAAQRARGLANCLVDRNPDCWNVLRQFGCSEKLISIFSTAFGSRRRFDRVAGVLSVPRQAAGGGAYGFEPRHVAQLLGKDEFERNFVGFFPGIQPNSARRFCAMALVRLCGRYTWAEAAENLMLPAGPGEGMANRAVGVLRQANTYEAFARELHQVAAALDARPRRKDFGSIRQALSGFKDIPKEDWRRICTSARVGVGKSGARSRYAAAWLWAELTGGDWRLAPGLAGGHVRSHQHYVFRRLNESIFPKLAPDLIAYGNRLLREHLLQKGGSPAELALPSRRE